jgi:hypothetical protein
VSDHTITRGHTASPVPSVPAHSALLLQRCPCGGSPGVDGECEECRTHRLARQPTSPGPGPGLAPPIVHDVLRAPGQPLDAATRAFMEPRFGHDFGRVRIHTDARAAASARAVDALAYTVGRDVVFGSGQYAPRASWGRRLLAHELTHVVQQSKTQTLNAYAITGNNADQAEREAHLASSTIMHGGKVNPGVSKQRGIQRDTKGSLGGTSAGGSTTTASVESLPVGQYVDAFESIVYNLDYRSERHGLSKWLQVTYAGGVNVDINIDEISSETEPTAELIKDVIDQAYVGAGNRVFPKRLNRSTVPRLWSAKQSVLEIMDTYNLLFLIAVFPTVYSLIVPPVSFGGRPARATVRPLRRSVSRPTMSAGEETAAKASPPRPQAPKQTTGVPETGTPGSRQASVGAANQRESMRSPATPLPASQQAIRNTLLREHPGLAPNVAEEAARGGAGAKGPGGAGADVPLINGGGREVSVHAGTFTREAIGGHLAAKAAQRGTTEIYLQIKSSRATKSELIGMIPRLRAGYPDLRGIMVKLFGPNGDLWWSGVFTGPPE